MSEWQVALAALLILVNAALSVAFRLELERAWAIARLRTIGQLLLIGLVLSSVFSLNRWYLVLGLAAAMTMIAGITASRRNRRRYPGITLNTMLSIWCSAWLVTAFALTFLLNTPRTWYEPRYSIPLLGMILGNTLNGISLGLNAFTEGVLNQRGQIDAWLAMGATRWEAARPTVRDALRTGLLPIMNSMMIVGVVSLPGMMTGQLLAGAAPMEAVKYQIVIMFLIASATALGTFGAITLSFFRLFNDAHQFRADLLSERRRGS